MKTLIIDDEIAAIENLEILLGKYCKEVEIVGTARSAKEGYELIR